MFDAIQDERPVSASCPANQFSFQLGCVSSCSGMCRIVSAFRAWMAGHGGGGPVPLKKAGDLLPKEELLNHYSQHTTHCPSCSKVPSNGHLLPLRSFKWNCRAIVGCLLLRVFATKLDS